MQLHSYSLVTEYVMCALLRHSWLLIPTKPVNYIVHRNHFSLLMRSFQESPLVSVLIKYYFQFLRVFGSSLLTSGQRSLPSHLTARHKIKLKKKKKSIQSQQSPWATAEQKDVGGTVKTRRSSSIGAKVSHNKVSDTPTLLLQV